VQVCEFRLQLALRSGYSSSKPCWVAQTAAWARELRFSLLRMLEMWCLTVLSERNRSAAICLFVFPCAASLKTRFSWSESAALATSSVLAVIGPFNSGCAEVEIPIANRAEPGPLPVVSPTASYIGLTRKGPGVLAGQPASLYPKGGRNFVRVYPSDDAQAAADALLAKRLGVKNAYVFLGDPNEAYEAGLAYSFAKAARRLGIQVTGPESPRSSGFASLANRLRRSHVNAVFVAALENDRSAAFIRAMRRELARLTILAPDAFLPAFDQVHEIGPAAVGMYVSGAKVTDPTRQLPSAGRRFTKAFGATQRGRNLNIFAPYAAQAAEVLLDAISRSDGTRASVARELLRVRLSDSIFGPFTFDRNGDSTTNLLPIFRVARSKPNVLYPTDRVVTVIRVPARLLR